MRQKNYLDEKNRADARQHQADDLLDMGVVKLYARRPAELEVNQSRNLHQEEQQRTEHSPIHQAMNSQTQSRERDAPQGEALRGGENQHPNQHAHIIHAGRQRGQQKMLVSLQSGDHQSAHRKEQCGK